MTRRPGTPATTGQTIIALAAALAVVGASAPAWAAPAATSREITAPDVPALEEADTSSAAEEHEDEGEEVETSSVAVEVPGTITSTGPRYTADITDAHLAALWKDDRKGLGSISMGANDFGRVVNGVPFPEDPRWLVIDPPNTYGTRETIDYLVTVLSDIHARFPDAPPMRVNHISTPVGGYLRPHRSHQLGRDVDLGLYYDPKSEPRHRVLDLEMNWVLLKALLVSTDVEVVLLDRRIIKTLHAYAASKGEDKTWLDRVFGVTGRALVQHARGHRDHFHVRFYNPRAQELGWRIQPLLTKDETVPQVMRHRIRSGDNLGKIAQRYGVTITAIKKLNRMKSNFLRAGQSLAVPVRGMACDRCPTMARVVVPARILPPPPVPTELLATPVLMVPGEITQAAAMQAAPGSVVEAAAPEAPLPAAPVAPVIEEAHDEEEDDDFEFDLPTRRGLAPPLT